MEGYLLLNESGAKLTRNLRWSDEESAGWLWTEDEVEKILGMAADWEHKPVYYQHCRLIEEDGDVNVEPLDEVKEL